jgi:hypothetical protein
VRGWSVGPQRPRLGVRAAPGAPVRSLRNLKNSENNSEFLQIGGRWRSAARAVSTACGEIPCAAEQGSGFAVTGK